MRHMLYRLTDYYITAKIAGGSFSQIKGSAKYLAVSFKRVSFKWETDVHYISEGSVSHINGVS